MSFEKCKVIMLPADVKSDTPLGFQTHGCGQDLVIGRAPRKGYGQGDSFNPYYPQHLYILSDDEIKEGDWFLSNLNEILKCTKREDKFVWYETLTVSGVSKVAQPFSIHINLLKSKKVIATTDKNLFTKIPDGILTDGITVFERQYKKQYLPEPSQGFIEKYVREYNKGNIITDVMVEYWDHTEENIQYKINPKDNTITIHKVKDSWSRDEVVELLKEMNSSILDSYSQMNDKEFNQWIEDNL